MCSVREGVLRSFAKFTEKHFCQFLFNKVAGLTGKVGARPWGGTQDASPANLLKNRLWHRCFPVNFAKFLRTPFLQNTSGQLLLYLA